MFCRLLSLLILLAASMASLSAAVFVGPEGENVSLQARRDRVVLVTGASGGIGEAVAKCFSEKEGYKVYGSTRQVGLLGNKRLQDASGKGYELVLMDPGDTGSVNKAVDAIVEKDGAVDILINSAGYMVLGSVESIDPDKDLMPLLNVNVAGYMRTTAAVLPGMRKKQQGVIINVTSVQAFEPRALQEAYSATRSAVETMSLGQDSYLRESGIRVLVYQPGATKTKIAVNSLLGGRQIEGDFATSPISKGCLYSAQRAFKGWMVDRLEEGGVNPEVVGRDIVGLVEDTRNTSFRKQLDDKGKQRARFVYGEDYEGGKIREKLRNKFAVEKKQWAIYGEECSGNNIGISSAGVD